MESSHFSISCPKNDFNYIITILKGRNDSFTFFYYKQSKYKIKKEKKIAKRKNKLKQWSSDNISLRINNHMICFQESKMENKNIESVLCLNHDI